MTVLRQSCAVFCDKLRIRNLRISHENLRICDVRTDTADLSSAKRFQFGPLKVFLLFQWKPRFARITRLSPVAGKCFRFS
jgi:hypothetical protein